MIVIKTAASLVSDLVMALGLSFLVLFIALAYFEPMLLDTLVHQAHDVVPTVIDGFIAFVKNLF